MEVVEVETVPASLRLWRFRIAWIAISLAAVCGVWSLLRCHGEAAEGLWLACALFLIVAVIASAACSHRVDWSIDPNSKMAHRKRTFLCFHRSDSLAANGIREIVLRALDSRETRKMFLAKFATERGEWLLTSDYFAEPVRAIAGKVAERLSLEIRDEIQ